ncbi:MAG TPA: hypothetical protein VHD36_12065 [Pirellulales bacterium]|nr:hypothetical protein [Pirellulales bacterium]
MGRRGPKPVSAAALLARGNVSLARKRARQEAALTNGTGSLAGWTPADVEQLAWGGVGPFGDPLAGNFDWSNAAKCWRDIERPIRRAFRDELEQLNVAPIEPRCWYELTNLIPVEPFRDRSGKAVHLPALQSLSNWALWQSPPGAAPSCETRLSYYLRLDILDLSTWQPSESASSFWGDYLAEQRALAKFQPQELASLAILFDPDGSLELLTREEMKRAREYMN